jgi:hypothetical protein
MTGLHVHGKAVTTDLIDLAAVALLERHKPDCAMAMLVVAPVNEYRHS